MTPRHAGRKRQGRALRWVRSTRRSPSPRAWWRRCWIAVAIRIGERDRCSSAHPWRASSQLFHFVDAELPRRGGLSRHLLDVSSPRSWSVRGPAPMRVPRAHRPRVGVRRWRAVRARPQHPQHGVRHQPGGFALQGPPPVDACHAALGLPSRWISPGSSPAAGVRIAFWLKYAIGGSTNVPLGTVFTAWSKPTRSMDSAKGSITGLTVGAVLSVRPDLVFGAKDLMPTLTVSPSTASRNQDGSRLIDGSTVGGAEATRTGPHEPHPVHRRRPPGRARPRVRESVREQLARRPEQGRHQRGVRRRDRPRRGRQPAGRLRGGRCGTTMPSTGEIAASSVSPSSSARA